ncbi:MAG: cytochrome c [Casimicrobiaceae bacterium]
MMRLVAIVAVATCVLLAAVGAASAETSPTATDIAAGRALSDRDCVACHRQKFGTPEAIYLRPDRKVKSLAALRLQVARCNVELATQYFPDEEEQVTAYLNATHYRFTQ